MLERVFDIFRDKLELSPSVELTRETKYGDIEEWDSFGHITILSAIESEFGISFTFEEISEIESIGNICDILEDKGISK